jgi:hypothetical protein
VERGVCLLFSIQIRGREDLMMSRESCKWEEKGDLGERLCGLPFFSFPTTRACGLEYDSDSELVSNLG